MPQELASEDFLLPPPPTPQGLLAQLAYHELSLGLVCMPRFKVHLGAFQLFGLGQVPTPGGKIKFLRSHKGLKLILPIFSCEILCRNRKTI
jgi:hypothetical protein